MCFLIITLEFVQRTIVMTSSSTMEFVCFDKEGMIDIMWMNVCIGLNDVRHDSEQDKE